MLCSIPGLCGTWARGHGPHALRALLCAGKCMVPVCLVGMLERYWARSTWSAGAASHLFLTQLIV